MRLWAQGQRAADAVSQAQPWDHLPSRDSLLSPVPTSGVCGSSFGLAAVRSSVFSP